MCMFLSFFGQDNNDNNDVTVSEIHQGRGSKQVGASPPTSLSKCQVIGSCRFHFVFFHVSEFKNQWWARKRRRAGGAEEGLGRRHVGSGPFFAGLASIGRRSWRGFACCPGKRTSERSPKGEKEEGEKEGGWEIAREVLREPYPRVDEGEKVGKAVCRRDGCLDWGRTRLEGRSEDEDKGG